MHVVKLHVGAPHTHTTTVLPEMLTRLLWWVTRLLMLCALGTCHERPQREPPKFTNALDWLLITEGVSHLHALPDVGQTKRGERMRSGRRDCHAAKAVTQTAA
jgi:hypothetical protein